MLLLQDLNGSYEKSYTFVPSLCQVVTDLNQGSIANFTYSKDEKGNRFESLTVSFNAQCQGFNNGCRSVIGLDGCHLKGKFGGVMLAATALDGQNGLHPLGIFIYRNETEANWHTFLKYLKPRVISREGLTFISDRQKGLLEAVAELFPQANHRYCFR